jgi:hypothetical protein
MFLMTIPIVGGPKDDHGFIELLNSLVNGLLADFSPERFWIIQIDNWFDHKWLKFSGNGAATSAIPLDGYDTVKAEFYQDKLTFPAFSPNRVLSQWSYVRTGEGYAETPFPALPHSTERQHTNNNLHRRVLDFDRSASFLWYSSNTHANGRGSVMVYNTEVDRFGCWFAAFRRQRDWALHATKGVSSSEIERLLNTGRRSQEPR